MGAPNRPSRLNSPLTAFAAAERIVALKESEKARLELVAKREREATMADIDHVLSRVEEDERPRVIVLVEAALGERVEREASAELDQEDDPQEAIDRGETEEPASESIPAVLMALPF